MQKVAYSYFSGGGKYYRDDEGNIIASEGMYEVRLTYFTRLGKYYSKVTYLSNKESLYEIWEEVHFSVKEGALPELCPLFDDGFHILIEVPDHPYSHPRLLVW